ncbi:MAG: glycosyltransferase [Acidobacteria bacterium]|nr:glycosyltransferase [Acidobacteriota bacterium]
MDIKIKEFNRITSQRVSVVVTVLNDKKGIITLFESLQAQSLKPNEIIIVDGGSTDGTVEELKSYQERMPEIHILVKPGLNISEGRNYGIRHSTCPIIAVTDAGCRPDSNWLLKLAKPLIDDPEAMAVGGLIAIDAHNSIEKVSGMLMLPRSASFHTSETVPLLGRCSAFRKEAWQKADGYPEWLYTGEDTLFGHKLRVLELKIIYAPEAVVYWQPRSSFYKLFKMFFLYGKGNGRIGHSPGGISWHLRRYILELILLCISAIWPIFLIPLIFVLVYYFIAFYIPIISSIRDSISFWETVIYAPTVIWTKTFGYTAGILFGTYEYKFVPPFRQNLTDYLGMPKKAE